MFRLLLRLRFDPKSIHKISFGDKFGATVKIGEFLLKKASEIGLNIYGVAFHIGIGCLEYEIFETAIRVSGEMFEYGKSLGHRMKLLDIGGGFPGHEIKTIVKFYYFHLRELIRKLFRLFFTSDWGFKNN